MVIPFSILLRVIRYSIDQFTNPYFRAKYGNKYDGEELDKKVLKCSKGLFKVLHFSFTFLLGMKVVSETNFHSPLMFGSGNTSLVFADWPFTAMADFTKFYYMWSLCYYVEDMFVHCFMPPNSDFWEMILHHVVAILLIFASYMNGFWMIGIYVLMQMDISDVFVGLIRVVMDFAPIPPVAVIYI